MKMNEKNKIGGVWGRKLKGVEKLNFQEMKSSYRRFHHNNKIIGQTTNIHSTNFMNIFRQNWLENFMYENSLGKMRFDKVKQNW